MREIPFKKLKRTPLNKISSNNYGRNKRLLVKGKKKWEEQEDQPNKGFKIHVPLNKPPSELLSVRKNTLQKYKLAMAYLSRRIMADPTLMDYQETLLGFLIEKCPLVALTVRKFAVITIMEIFSDILPERKIIEMKKVHNLKEEVRETYKREDIILKFYMKYLRGVMENLNEAKKNKTDPGFQSMETTMVTCLSTMFVKHPLFNYHKDLLNIITPYVSSPQKATRHPVFKIFVEFLSNDQTGEMSLMIVKSIYTTIMKRRLHIHQDVVKVLYHLRLEHLYNIDKICFEKKRKSETDHKELLLKKLKRKNGRIHYSRKEQKEYKKDLHKNENKWLENKEKLIEQQEGNNTEVLQLTLGIYFLILKKRPKPLVISAVFEGLARYAHLINIEFFCDLLKVMDEFFSSYRLKTTDQLNCIQTVFTILQTQSESLAIDPYRFYIHLYNVLANLSTEASLENLQVTVNTFNMLFLGKKSSVISVPRILALMKRLSSMASYMPNHAATLIILSVVSRHFTLNTFNEILLDTDQHGWPGRFTMYNKEPDAANAGATALWELFLTRRSYHPHVRKLSEAMINGDIYRNENSLVKRLINRSTQDLHKDYNLKRGVLNPGIPCPAEAIKDAKKAKITDSLSFNNLELYEQCMNAIEEDDTPPPSKKLKLDDSCPSPSKNLNFFESALKEVVNDEPDHVELEDFSVFFLGE